MRIIISKFRCDEFQAGVEGSRSDAVGYGASRLSAVVDLLEKFGPALGIEIEDRSRDDADCLAAKIAERCGSANVYAIAEIIRNHTEDDH